MSNKLYVAIEILVHSRLAVTLFHIVNLRIVDTTCFKTYVYVEKVWLNIAPNLNYRGILDMANRRHLDTLSIYGSKNNGDTKAKVSV